MRDTQKKHRNWSWMRPTMMIKILCAFLLLSIGAVDAFTLSSFSRRNSVATTRGLTHPATRCRAALPGGAADGLGQAALVTAVSPTVVISDAIDIAKNVFIGVGAVATLLFGIALIFSTFVIPKAAEQLELQARELDPELWAEYEERLETGEILAMRPDLIQELGDKVRARTIAKFDEEVERREAQRAGRVSSSDEDTTDSSSMMDAAEVITAKKRVE